MAAVLSTAADIVNDALVRIGYKKLVGELQDGSEAAQLALAIYGQTRDELLRGGDWGFAQGDVTLTLLKSAPPGGYVPGYSNWSSQYPPLPWLFEYAYNDDMIQVRSIRPQSIFVPNFDPQPHTFNIANDSSYTPAKKVILTNVQDAICTYTRQVIDPTTWEPDFAEAFAEELGERLAAGLVGTDAAKLEAAEAQVGLSTAEVTQG
jgi:hypothetical protein